MKKKNLTHKTVGVRIARTLHEAVVAVARRETKEGRPLSVEDIYGQAIEAWLKGGKNDRWLV
tara:strand:- start:4 stop:189 length:186 start_codon:yes stop_codon:yes gene_type:complete